MSCCKLIITFTAIDDPLPYPIHDSVSLLLFCHSFLVALWIFHKGNLQYFASSFEFVMVQVLLYLFPELTILGFAFQSSNCLTQLSRISFATLICFTLLAIRFYLFSHLLRRWFIDLAKHTIAQRKTLSGLHIISLIQGTVAAGS